MTLLDGYAAANPNRLRHTFRARPLSIQAPCGFVDGIDESEIVYSAGVVQRTPEVRVRLVRGTFSSGDVADANDELVDDFIAYVRDNPHAAGASTLLLVSSVEDDDGWQPEWMPEDKRGTFYTTLITLAGEGQFGSIA